MDTSKSEHVINLAREILDDIELSRLGAQAILLKTTRLARYVDEEEIRAWLRFEMQGFSDDPIALKYMSKTSRWTDFKKKEGYWGSLAKIEATAEAQKQKLSLIRIPDTSGDRAIFVIDRVTTQMNDASHNIAKLESIKSIVISLIHDFVANVYYQKTFDNVAEGIFDKYKKDIDILIAANSGDILGQIPAVVDRLSNEDKESISQALNTCRRIVDSFANHIFPAREDSIEIGGNILSLKQDKVLNRINAFIQLNTESESRKKKLRQNLSNLYDRTSAGVHSDIDTNEAKSLFFNTYLLLGEILSLKK
ncbi:hypothetical protein EHQ16_07910 [Leptospira kanakyensis]|uniref:AbiTii domain-containing protein n=1 Tax=Leptospira kanakyensis TaxID=2484968 RepID=A0A6N4Q239_9LEPT|nr:hypothetical protein [Leptospira kanakyensis]TGK48793.1 hypothetical protein EHQ11_15710 [Leptospira kanakyensis]TGK61217.1 hypothetical protein EHQ16_07910 [Leptospira kanakyensis]TGK71064.1 hypothetical protein EHQ18_08345 [Leptospira kanakyensis]